MRKERGCEKYIEVGKRDVGPRDSMTLKMEMMKRKWE